MMSKCTAYSTDRLPSPPKAFGSDGTAAPRNRLHYRHQPERAAEELGGRNRLHVKHPAGEPVLPKRAGDTDPAAVLNASFMRELNAAEDEDVYISPTLSSVNSPEPDDEDDLSSGLDSNTLSDALLRHGLAGESPKERKQREKYIKKLARAREQVARLAGYQAGKELATAADKENVGAGRLDPL